MSFQFAYSLDGDAAQIVKDFPLDTVAAYKTQGTNGITKGDLVILTAGLVRRAITASTAAVVAGVLEGEEFTGLVASGQPYAAANSSFIADATDLTRNPNGVGKVRTGKTNVYRVGVNQASGTVTATNAHIGGSYQIIADAAGNQTVDLNITTNALVKVIDRSTDGKTVFVTLI